MKYINFLTILLVINSLDLTSQQYKFDKYYSNQSTLSYFLVKDTLWIGTSNCLMKVLTTEDKVIQVYSSENSPINGSVNSIFVNKSNQIAVILNDNTIALLSDGIWQNWNGSTVTSLPGNRFNFSKIAISNEGIIYCIEWNSNKIFSYRNNKWRMEVDLKPENINFRKFLQKSDGSIWWLSNTISGNFVTAMDSSSIIKLPNFVFDVDFHTDGTLYGIKEDGSIINIFSSGTFIIKGKIQSVSIDNPSIHVGKQGVVYVNQDKELYILKDKKISKFISNKFDFSNVFTDIREDDKGILWIQYGYNTSICSFDHVNFKFNKYGISSGSSVKSNRDKSILWFSSYNYISSYNVLTHEVKNYETPIGLGLYKFADSHDPKKMWMGTSNGLLHFDGNKWTLDSLLPKYTYIYDLKSYSPTQLLGLFIEKNVHILKVYDIPSKTWSDFTSGNSPLIITRFYLDKTNRAWANLFDSLVFFDLGKWQYLSPSNSGMPKEKWIHLAFDSKNHLYAASHESIYKYDGIKWEKLRSNFCNSVSDIFLDSRDGIWLINSCPGMSYFDGKNWKDLNSSNSNIPPIDYDKIEEDALGDIWISSDPSCRYKVTISKSSDLDDLTEELKIYPNPSNQFLTIEFPYNNGQFQIINSFGSELLLLQHSDKTIKLNLEKYTSGYYIIKWSRPNNKSISKSFIKI